MWSSWIFLELLYLAERTWCVWALRSFFIRVCRTSFLASTVLAAFSLMINKNAIKLILMKSSDIKMSLNKHRCVLPRVWNSVHMFPFDPCYCSHWNTNPSDIPTTTWLGLPQGQTERVGHLHACISVWLCVSVSVCVFVLPAAFQRNQSVAAAHVQVIATRGGEPCRRAAVGPLDETGLLDEVIYSPALAPTCCLLHCNSDSSRCKALWLRQTASMSTVLRRDVDETYCKIPSTNCLGLLRKLWKEFARTQQYIHIKRIFSININ